MKHRRRMRRSSGLLLHPTSLPGRLGSGDIGPDAYDFLDDLREMGQSWWQMLPVNPPGDPPGNSPYTASSAFAGSPWLVSLELLAADGLLGRRDLGAGRIATVSDGIAFRRRCLARAFENFDRQAAGANTRQYRAFCKSADEWLGDYTLFAALKDAFGDVPWTAWPADLRRRTRAAIDRARHEHAHAIRFHAFVQFQFHRQWRRLREHARQAGIRLIGDLPIFVSHDSADVWAHPELFVLDRRGNPTVVSGAPPDIFSATGQRWGHPHYRWPAHRRTGFAWWMARFARLFDLFDCIRIDHFLGFVRAWTIPAAAKTAGSGDWVAAPGAKLFAQLRKTLPRAEVIAEDLGAPNPAALALREHFGFPGMRVLQFGFGDDDDYHRPHAWPRACVAYTGTHDNDTVTGWYRAARQANGDEWRRLRTYVDPSPGRAHWDLIRAVAGSRANLAIFPVQDLLGLASRCRMNTPGTCDNNWRWRMSGRLPAQIKREMHELAQVTSRIQ